jgi:hypothetical protein
MTRLMVYNLKNMHDSYTRSDLVDPSMYMKLIGSLMYPTHTRSDMQFIVSAFSQFIVESRERN